MSPNDIKQGCTYANRGAGKTRRKVIKIGMNLPIRWFGDDAKEPKNEPVVIYEQDGKRNSLYLGSFAQWCGKRVEGA
jgi:hypothetical protein